jgi:hypothetical protein
MRGIDCQTHENHELHLLILMWVPGPEVAENEPRLYSPVAGPVSACEPGNARRVGFAKRGPR